ncbi:MAG: IclR family transcriptional regulator [Boseongicola sp.]|nr:IclR family transcriptional regulator [Boseongicola sp.]
MTRATSRVSVIDLIYTADARNTPSDAIFEETRREQLSELGVTGKAFMILELITRASRPISISEMIRTTRLTKPTAHRVVNMLVEMGFVERDASQLGFVEGQHLVTLALQTLVESAPRSLRHTILQEVVAETGETCNFGTLSGSDVIYLDRVESKWPLGLRFAAGSRVPAHCTAIGKLMLSFRSDDELQSMFQASPLPAYTSATIVDPDRLVEALREVRQDRIGTDNQEFMHGVVCVAVPVIDSRRKCLSCIALSAPEARMTLNEMLGFVPKMRDAASRIASTFAHNSANGTVGK